MAARVGDPIMVDRMAGLDAVAELVEAVSGPGAIDYGRAFDRTFSAISELTVPVIARIQGVALGGGCQLAVASDMAVAAEDARLGIPSARLGVVISYESIERLVLAVGPKRAGEFLSTGRILSGGEAAGWGMVNRAVPPTELDGAVREMASAVADCSPLSVRASKRGMTSVLETSGWTHSRRATVRLISR